MAWLLQLFRCKGLLSLSLHLKFFQFLCHKPLYLLLLHLKLCQLFRRECFLLLTLCLELSSIDSALVGCLRVPVSLMLWPAWFRWKTACTAFALDWVGGLWWGSSTSFTAWCMAFHPVHSIECGSAEPTSEYNVPQTICLCEVILQDLCCGVHNWALRTLVFIRWELQEDPVFLIH